MVEDALPYYARAHGVQSVPLRYFNAAGADPEGELGSRNKAPTNLIPVVVGAAAGLIPHVKVFGTDYATADGTAVRDYIHVMDLCEAHLAAIEYLARGGETRAFNLGVGRGFTVKQVIDAVRRISGREFRVIDEARRPGDASEVVADSSLANQVFGWKARYDLDEIVAHSWAWQLKMMDGNAPAR
jgi:UDP-glucose 4-epimerase